MRNKKFISILLTLTLILTAFNTNSFSQREIEYEPKIYTSATIDCDISGRFVLVMLDKSVGGGNKRHNKRLFGGIEIKEITDLTENTVITRKDYNPNDCDKEYSRQIEESFRQILQLELPKDCKQNVLDVIARLEKIDGILAAGPVYRLYPDSAETY